MSMIRLEFAQPTSIEDAMAHLQTAVEIEFGTLPPYLYTLYSIPPGVNEPAARSILDVALEEMQHLCLVCNILNAIGGDPQIKPMSYPSPLPGDIGPPGGDPLVLELLPFSKRAMEQGENIEQPENPPDFPEAPMLAEAAGAVTIGQFYRELQRYLKEELSPYKWIPNRNQLTGSQFFPGEVFPVNNYADASRAIDQIVSEGEGTEKGSENNPIDFKGDVAHYFRFGEIRRNKVLTKIPEPPGYRWGPPFGVDWSGVYPAIENPGQHDFSDEPTAAQAAQKACTDAYVGMVDALQQAVRGDAASLGIAVRAMFDLRTAARHAFTVPLADGEHVAGPAFVYPRTPEEGTR